MTDCADGSKMTVVEKDWPPTLTQHPKQFSRSWLFLSKSPNLFTVFPSHSLSTQTHKPTNSWTSHDLSNLHGSMCFLPGLNQFEKHQIPYPALLKGEFSQFSQDL